MSKRRDFADFVLLDCEDDGPYQARILTPPSGDGYDLCMLDCGDSACREWRTLEVLNTTDQFVYHVSECVMRDVPAELADK
ncbi:hypothetical protein A1D17_03665 [Pseudomonas fluorescens]|uniref:Uncharacterized protein n=1 Tax=Pseudomonas fluorescens TaxID=294 RepID=A0A166QPL3_PSEFL|nr:hypothetical protein A1D17_03665 [Pseudomonas fluorescens]